MARRRKEGGNASVVGVDLDSRPLVVIDSRHPIWDEFKTVSLGPWLVPPIIWVEPPADASDVRIETVVGWLKGFRPAAVRVLPRVAGRSALPADEVQDAVERQHEAEPASRVREVVAELIAETTLGVDERFELASMVDAYLTRAGL
jgi:hypothetical protein